MEQTGYDELLMARVKQLKEIADRIDNILMRDDMRVWETNFSVLRFDVLRMIQEAEEA